MPGSYTPNEQAHEPRDRSLRAADSDRDAIADILREQHVAGRIGTDELQERLDRCFSAKTYGELDELVADLPRQEPMQSVSPAHTASRRWRWRPVLPALLLIAAIVVSHGHLLWLVIPLFFFVGRPLLWRSAGHRFGWGYAGCGGRRDPSPTSYV
jgi:hypothetical protein